MTELKTLKDFMIWFDTGMGCDGICNSMCKEENERRWRDCKRERDYYVDLYELRASAIKWIKELNKKELRGTPIGTTLYYGTDVSLGNVEDITNWIKHFFGITDKEREDLK